MLFISQKKEFSAGENEYPIGEIHYFLTDNIPEGFVPADGRTINLANYPKAKQYFSTTAGRSLCFSATKYEEERARKWVSAEHIIQNGGNIGFNGIGGSARFVCNGNSLTLPDLRGMFPEMGGTEGRKTGDSHGDFAPEYRALSGFQSQYDSDYYRLDATRKFYGNLRNGTNSAGNSSWVWNDALTLPTQGSTIVERIGSTSFSPKAYIVNACIWLGTKQ